jgi:hypothetical protein
MGAPAAAPRTRWLRVHLGSGHVSRVIYGAIIGLALVLALEHHPPPAGTVTGALVATAVAVGLAEIYAEMVGGVGPKRLAHSLEDAVAVAFGIAFPAVFFLMVSAGLIELDTAFGLAKWTGLGLIGFYGFCGARIGGKGVLGSLANALGVVLIGAVLVALKSLLH